MKIVYAVPWIEVEFGQRPEGYSIFTDLKDCIKKTLAASKRGASPSGMYCGPERPLHYYEVPFEVLEDGVKEKLAMFNATKAHSSNCWSPSMKSDPKIIK